MRLQRQRSLDWEQIGLSPRYEIASIKEPGKLKVRQDQLADLRRGFLGQTSYTITGQKRVGKTSLTQVLLQDLRRNPAVVARYLTIGDTGVIAANPSEMLDRFAESLAQRIADEYAVQMGAQLPTLEPGTFARGRGLLEFSRVE